MPNVIEITDIYAKGPDVFSRLTGNQLESKQHPENGLFITESPDVIFAALDAGYEPVSALAERKRLAALTDEQKERLGDIPIYTADAEILEGITGFRLTRGMLCAFRRRPLPDVSEAIAGAERLAVLWDIVDQTNVGSIFRSAAALGADAVLLSPRCCSPLTRRASRVSMGTAFKIPFAVLPEGEPEEVLGLLHDRDFHTCALALERDALPLDSPELAGKSKLAAVLGTEGDGLPKRVIEACRSTVYIPMRNGVESLNVGSAAAVAFWQLFGKKA